MGGLALSFLAGALTTLSPCVLPLLPIILGGAVQQHRLAPVALAGGLALSFTSVGLFVATLGFAVGFDGATLRTLAAMVMVVFGAVMLVPRLQLAFASATAPISGSAGGMLARISGEGLGGQFLLGLVLGAAWSPCAGPSLGAAIGMASQGETMMSAAVIMAFFAIGAVTPLLALAYGSRKALSSRRNRMARLAAWGKPAMGGMLLAFGFLIVSGLDKVIEARLVAASPAWLVALTTRF